MNMTDIEKSAAAFAAARDLLARTVAQMSEQIEAVKNKFLPTIKRRAAVMADLHTQLETAIAQSPELFNKPRSQTFHGIKVGYRKGSGGIDWDDDQRVADLVRKHFPEQFDVLVKTTYKPLSKALEQLDVADLKKIGCRVESTGDVVFIKPTDSEVDKLVSTLLKGLIDEAQKEAA